MAVLCIATAPGHAANSGPLATLIARLGHDLIDQHDLEAGIADALVYFAPPVLTPAIAIHWLSLVNRTRVDILVVDTPHAPLPSDAVLSAESVSRSSRLTGLSERLDTLLAEDIHRPRIPRILRTSEDLNSPYSARTEPELLGLLRDESARVITAPREFLNALTSRPLSNRQDYDLARFIRWSKDQLDSAFVKLRLSLAGADSLNSLVTRSPSSLFEVLADTRSGDLMVLRGAPGSGKSMQLRFLETAVALTSIRTHSDGSQPLVFCVNLGEHAVDKSLNPHEWMQMRWARRVQVDRMQPLDVWLRGGRTLLLLDGFNEVPFGSPEERRNWMLKWRQCVHEEILGSAGNRAIVACRSRDLNVSLGSRDLTPTYIDLAPLTKSEIIAIARATNPRAYEKMSDALDADASFIELYQTPFCLTDYLKYATGDVPRSQSEIFWRRICAVLQRERDGLNFQMFDARWLPDASISRLLSTRTVREAIPIMRTIPLLASLGKMAQNMTENSSPEGQHRTSLELTDCFGILREHLNLPDDGIASEVFYSTIDLDLLVMHDGIVRFQHQTLQDFFAAVTVDDDVILAAISIDSNSYTARLGNLLDVTAQMGPGDELQLVPGTGFEEIFARATELRPSLILKAAQKNPWLAAERIRLLDASSEAKAKALSEITDELRERAANSLDVRERVASLTTLSLIEPSQHEQSGGAGYTSLLPKAMILAQEWALGCGAAGRSSVGSVRPPINASLSEFRIGVFAVTNAEYAQFMLDGGYATERYWSLEGWMWRSGRFPFEPMRARWTARRDSVASQPEKPLSLLRSGRVSIVEAAAIIRFGRMSDDEVEQVARTLVGAEISAPAYFSDARFSNPLQPVVGISWHEASAYCRWLSEKTSQTIRLPTENEWEAAALQGQKSLVDSIDAVRIPSSWSEDWGNTAEIHIGRTTPVGAFVGANASADLLPAEMAGNVFEWVTDPVNPGEEWRRVVKGGSWRHLMRRAHPGYRGRGDTTTRNDDNGFRIVMT